MNVIINFGYKWMKRKASKKLSNTDLIQTGIEILDLELWVQV